MCVMCQILDAAVRRRWFTPGSTWRSSGWPGAAKARLARLTADVLDAVKAHAGSREWVHGFLFRWGLDNDRLIEAGPRPGPEPPAVRQAR